MSMLKTLKKNKGAPTGDQPKAAKKKQVEKRVNEDQEEEDATIVAVDFTKKEEPPKLVAKKREESELEEKVIDTTKLLEEAVKNTSPSQLLITAWVPKSLDEALKSNVKYNILDHQDEFLTLDNTKENERIKEEAKKKRIEEDQKRKQQQQSAPMPMPTTKPTVQGMTRSEITETINPSTLRHKDDTPFIVLGSKKAKEPEKPIVLQTSPWVPQAFTSNAPNIGQTPNTIVKSIQQQKQEEAEAKMQLKLKDPNARPKMGLGDFSKNAPSTFTNNNSNNTNVPPVAPPQPPTSNPAPTSTGITIGSSFRPQASQPATTSITLGGAMSKPTGPATITAPAVVPRLFFTGKVDSNNQPKFAPIEKSAQQQRFEEMERKMGQLTLSNKTDQAQKKKN